MPTKLTKKQLYKDYTAGLYKQIQVNEMLANQHQKEYKARIREQNKMAMEQNGQPIVDERHLYIQYGEDAKALLEAVRFYKLNMGSERYPNLIPMKPDFNWSYESLLKGYCINEEGGYIILTKQDKSEEAKRFCKTEEVHNSIIFLQKVGV